jgi:cbb3-type cytochrome oxidase subunit 1
MSGMVWLAARPDILATYHYNQYVVSLTHLFVLGFICSVVMGAMYQLVPVALEARLHSEKMARWQFGLHAVGFVGMVWAFWIWDLKQAGHAGSVLAIGVGLFVFNIARTLRRAPRRNVVAGGITAALVWLSLGVLAGLYVAAAKCWTFSPFDTVAQMHAHAHLGVIGFFVMMIVSVSYKLAPMFALSEVQSERRAWWSVRLLNVGLAGLFLTILLRSAWKLAWALVILAALGVYVWELASILRARKRPVLDWGLKYFLTAVGLLAPLAALAVVLCWPGLPATPLTTQLENVYGFLGLVGLVGLAILGFLYKIIPFLVWYHSYSPLIGRAKVPALADLYSPTLQAAGYWLYLAGLLAVSVATALGRERAVQAGTLLLLASLLIFGLNLGKMLVHFFQPRMEPLASRPAVLPS